MQRPLHILQFGVDDSVFKESAASDTKSRQIHYSQLLESIRPGSSLSYLALSTEPNYTNEEFINNLSLFGMTYQNRKHMPNLWKTLKQIHNNKPIDVISNQNLAGEGHLILKFARQMSIPIVGQIHFDFFSKHAKEELFGTNWLGKIRYFLASRSIQHYSAMRVVSKRIANKLKENLNYLKPLACIPVASSLKVSHDIDLPRDPLVLFVGRFVEAKNLKFWLTIAHHVQQKYPEARFKCIGDGPLFKEVIAYSKNLKFSNPPEFTGNLPYTELSLEYSKARVLMLCSSNEGFGRVVIEAAKHKTPSICTHTSGLEDTIDHENSGFLLEHNKHEIFSTHLLQLLRDPERAREMGMAAANYVETHFNANKIAEQWVQFLVDQSR